MLRYVAKLQNWSNYNELHRFDVKTIKTFELGRKTTKVILFRWISIDLTSKRSKTLRYVAKLQNWSNYNELHRFDVKTIKTFELGRKTTKVILFRWICIDLTSKRSKTLRYVAKHSKQRKTTKLIKLQWIASIWRQNDQNFWVMSLNYKSNQITINCIDLMSKRSRMMSYVAKHSKQRKTTKLIKLQWIASIWRQNDQNFWVRSQNYKSDKITMHSIDLMS